MQHRAAAFPRALGVGPCAANSGGRVNSSSHTSSSAQASAPGCRSDCIDRIGPGGHRLQLRACRVLAAAACSMGSVSLRMSAARPVRNKAASHWPVRCSSYTKMPRITPASSSSRRNCRNHSTVARLFASAKARRWACCSAARRFRSSTCCRRISGSSRREARGARTGRGSDAARQCLAARRFRKI